ncbi:hypothetical protein C8J57DRAFT_1052200 [Mycena rebaudengoi]|nr:hypothetical protein C8J57DRAFT_1052200 [Mycena rebaudengoi]
MTSTTIVQSTPPLLYLDIPSTSTCLIDPQIEIVSEAQSRSMYLRGIIYHGENHFVARIVSKEGDVWFHDGIATGSHMLYEGNITNPDLLNGLHVIGNKKAVGVIYS